MKVRAMLPGLLAAAATASWGATAEQLEFFERNVRPVLAAQCHACHSAKAKSAFAGLRMDTRAGMMKGSDAGLVVIPGDPAASKLIKAVRGQLPQPMPPSGKLKDAEIAALEKWIADGAAWPDETATPSPTTTTGFDLDQRRREHWAWQPVRDVPKPPRFLESPGPRADPLTLLRRVRFDLTGLPPSPADVAAFERDSSPTAYARLVDRLLQSPQFGERMARRWMDLIRYSESHGSEGDPDVPHAWRYRDYLIRAFNADVPYDQLIREHLAGDLLPAPRIDAKTGINESLLATAHLRMVEHGFQPVDPWEDRVKWADNQIDVISKAFQGLTISCARCHDHKFDAISQRDFYALFGVLASARPTQVAIDDPAKLAIHREQLAALKTRIRRELAAAWKQAAPRIAERLVPAENEPRESPISLLKDWDNESVYWKRELAERGEFNRLNFQPAFDARKDYPQWTRHGTGAPAAVAPPGEFAIPAEGNRILTGIYPGGVYSHLLSNKHNAVVSTPRFKVETNWISFRILGGNFSNVQLIIENYAVPRGGIYHMRYSPKVDSMGWARWDARFWKGFSAYIEVATYEDVTHFTLDEEQGRMRPRPRAPTDGRSWFGVQQIVFHDSDARPKDVVVPVSALLAENDIGRVVANAADAWAENRTSEEQAALLDWCVRRGLLPSSFDAVPELRAAVEEYRRLEAQVPVARRAPGIVDEAGPDQRLLVRGGMKNFGDPVPRRYLSALDSKPYSGDARLMRLRLAEEIASPKNPLTARVIANRIWQWMFRRGIVATVDNFGKLGERPVDPDTLDYLAARFVNDGWSIKKMMRTLALSDAYQAAALPMRRLEAEEIRDAVLAASGRLDATQFGKSVPTYYAYDTGKTKGDNPKGPLDGLGRRSVYLETRRNVTHPFLEVFDLPKPNTTRGQRDVTTVPAQSLALMNSDFISDQSLEWARRLDGADVRSRIDEVWLKALGRRAKPEERDSAIGYLAALAKDYETTSMDARVWRDFVHSLFNFKEFLYVR